MDVKQTSVEHNLPALYCSRFSIIFHTGGLFSPAKCKSVFFSPPLHQLLPRSARSCGASLFLRAHVDVFNSWCLYLKRATPQRAARGPLTQWSSRTRGACRCLPRVRRSEYKHTHKVVDRGRLKLPAAINRPSHSLLNTPEHTNKLLRRSLEPFKEQVNKGKTECLDASAADELTN